MNLIFGETNKIRSARGTYICHHGAEVRSGTSAMPQINGGIVDPAGLLAGNENIMLEGSSGAGGAAGLGSTISDAVGQGMGALTGALGSLGGMAQ